MGELRLHLNDEKSLDVNLGSNKIKLNLDLSNGQDMKFSLGTKENLNFSLGEKDKLQLKLREATSGGTKNYNELYNKPQIEGVTLIGNKTYEELNMNRLTNEELEEILK